MSQRVYTGPRSDRGGGPTGWLVYVPWGLAALTVLGQVSWILAGGAWRTALTILTVITFFLASATHAYATKGAGWTAGFFAITLSFGWLIEVLGLVTKFPFGYYHYEDSLGWAIAGVPLLIPLAWSMMAYPVLLAAQRMATTMLGTAVFGGWLLASWDLFLDPQMVTEHYWTWDQVGWSLPGIPGIPLQNFLGWLLAAAVLMAVLNLLPRKPGSQALPTAMLAWVFVSNVLANLLFLHRPGVAIWGGVCMGIAVVPWLWRLWSQPQW